jgi:hypothetical protein
MTSMMKSNEKIGPMKKISNLFNDRQKQTLDKIITYSHANEGIKNIIENLPEYFFARTIDLDQYETGFHKSFETLLSNATAFNILLSIIRSHAKFDESVPSTIQVYLGPILSGAPFHSHGSALNALLYGRKRWTLLPPSKDVYTQLHPIAFDLKAYEGKLNDSMLEDNLKNGCHIEQREREIFFVPRHWSHQVINLVASVGFAVEIQDYY